MKGMMLHTLLQCSRLHSLTETHPTPVPLGIVTHGSLGAPFLYTVLMNNMCIAPSWASIVTFARSRVSRRHLQGLVHGWYPP
jgi:hypothetical protein